MDFVETFRVLSEELETKNRQLEDADEQLNKFYELRAKVIKKKKGFLPKVKILNDKSNFDLKIKVSKCLVSLSVKEKIVQAGGEVI